MADLNVILQAKSEVGDDVESLRVAGSTGAHIDGDAQRRAATAAELTLVKLDELIVASSRVLGMSFLARAGAAISGHRVVTPGADGRAGYASNTDAAHRHAPLWITTQAISENTLGTVVSYGEVEESSWSWTPGAALYLGSGGSLTEVPPASPALFSVRLAHALSQTRIFFDPSTPITLSP